MAQKLNLFEPKLAFTEFGKQLVLPKKADQQQISYLKNLLDTFALSTGLKVNFSKSSMIPINVSAENLASLAATFGCQIASLPFTYLGLPMGTTKPRMEDLTPLMDRVERRLTACSTFLSFSGRLQMINYVLTPTVTYAMCSLKLPIAVIENIDRARKQCL